MDLVSVRVEEAPTRSRVRLVGDVAYDDRPRTPEPYWFEFPEEFAGDLSATGNPWLACLLPLAVVRREPLRLCRPRDPTLVGNATRLMETWFRWNRRHRPSAEESRSRSPGVGQEAAACGTSAGDAASPRRRFSRPMRTTNAIHPAARLTLIAAKVDVDQP